MFDIKHFNLADPAPNLPLEAIHPISSRALALLVRNQSQPILADGFLNIYGAADMIDGLQHHHDNFLETIENLKLTEVFSDEDKYLQRKLRHEIVAYLNRLGQFYYFAKSSFVTSKLPNSTQLIPKIARFILFRDKHAAHRSIDAPRREDSTHHQKLQAWALSSISALVLIPKDEAKGLENFHKIYDPKIKWEENYVAFQMRGKGENDFLNFSIELEHPHISREAYSVLEKLVTRSN